MNKDNLGVGGSVTEVNVEKLQFADHTLSINQSPSENLSEVFRIYGACDRTPDYARLGFWYNAMNNGESLSKIAGDFVKSNEFKAIYGGVPSDGTLITLLYQHILGRTPDQGGYEYWMNSLHTVCRVQLLVEFSEYSEHKAALMGLITNGIIYQEWIG